jgi:hypothetical protein
MTCFDEFFLQVVDYSSAKEYADQLGIPFLETSVRSRISVSDQGFGSGSGIGSV